MATAKNARTRRSGHRIAVVGGGMAAARLVQQLAAYGDALDVTVIGEEPHLPYNRVLLADVLAGRYSPDVVALPTPPSAARWLRGVRAVRIDRAAGEVLCDGGQCVPYDSLVLATGSNPVLPPLRGLFEPDSHDLPQGVHAFRTMDDCLALATAVRPGVRTVVIGGGLLGVSAARALARRGAQVVLAQQGEHLMERQLDAGASQLLRQHVEALGVEVHTECRVRGLLTGPTEETEPTGPAEPAGAAETGSGSVRGSVRTVTAVELADGFRLDAELIVLACGVRPRVGLAQAAGLTVKRGIVVDDELRTSDPRIHAIGDCAEHDGVLYGLAGPAQEQADVLARLLAGPAPDAHDAPGFQAGAARTAPDGTGPGIHAGPDHTAHTAPVPAAHAAHSPDAHAAPAPDAPTAPAPDVQTAPAQGRSYTGTRSLTRLTLTGSVPGQPLDLAAFGEIDPSPGDDVVHLSDATRGAYRKVVVRGDRLIGGILLGDLGTVGALARTWEGDEPLPSAPLLHLLTNDGGS
ncbi:FAD-dependent oxidoreductase [Streptomyces sp. NPDC004647]|uniref:NAD(P)/FAD-dependent oxidoreductase n=1 Tax=Streptomyces sp. NPDC004647 TaxID=3154671 RepID=UPI0033B95712